VKRTGQKSGHLFDWGDYLEALIGEHGTLSAVAWKLVEKSDDVANIERALRRLRLKGNGDGGTWGRRLLRAFGMPRAVEARLRWMGLYHSPFNDLPISLCLDQLRAWDRPPVAESRARVWLHLGFASVALRSREFSSAGEQLEKAESSSPPIDAQVEIALSRAYLASRLEEKVDLEIAEALLRGCEIDRECFTARLIDHRAYHLNRGEKFHEALALYDSLPKADVHPFASYRRDAGLAYGHWRLGDLTKARAYAQRACDHAGDGGYVRLRVMALMLMARVNGDESYLARGRAIAERIEDAELLERIARFRRR
jgi:hypothetical protein